MTFTQSRFVRVARLAILVILFATCTLAAAQSEFVAYAFPAGDATGCPEGGLIADSAGNLYGTSSGCGTVPGTVFELSRPVPPKKAWTHAVLYQFTGALGGRTSPDGSAPMAGLLFDGAGNLYGTTTAGGTSASGTVFELSPPAIAGGDWTETVLHSFHRGPDDGASPSGSLAWGGAGKLYGVTYEGGKGSSCSSDGCGTVFQMSPPAAPGGAWTETVINFFFGPDGGLPSGTPIFDSEGDIYGTTQFANDNPGVVYRLKPPAESGGAWTYKVLYMFNSSVSDGAFPTGLTLRGRGVLYGTTDGGGANNDGTVFQLTPPAVAGGAWTETILHEFADSDGAFPLTGLIFDPAGNIYGTTFQGGDSTACRNGCGVVFELTPPASTGAGWTETTMHSFQAGKDGATPNGGLIRAKNGELFGITTSGGANGQGTLFGIVP
jgi:uncharacterized repeat protein (TIGR03803 family)